LFLTYYATRALSKGVKKINSGKNIKIIEQISLSQNSSIAIVEICNKKYLIGVSEKNIEIMRELEEDEINLEMENTTSFSEVLKEVIKKKK